jgi:hypothetical protein
MNTITKAVEIKDLQFIGNSAMILFLSNETSVIIPLDKFNAISNLTTDEKKEFEIIDGNNLSFLVLDEIYNLHDLTGI